MAGALFAVAELRHRFHRDDDGGPSDRKGLCRLLDQVTMSRPTSRSPTSDVSRRDRGRRRPCYARPRAVPRVFVASAHLEQSKAGLVLGQCHHTAGTVRRETAWVCARATRRCLRRPRLLSRRHDLTHTASKIDTSKTPVQWSRRLRLVSDARAPRAHSRTPSRARPTRNGGHGPLSHVRAPRGVKRYLAGLLATVVASRRDLAHEQRET